MGVIDDFKQEKNKKAIIIASEKMINDKYKINIDNKELIIIIENIIISICNDAILIKNVVKLIELNTIALTKIKDYVEKYIINKHEEIIYQPEQPVDRELINNKYDTEDLLSKVIELEEKRKTLNTIVNLDSIKEPDIPNVANNIENKSTILFYDINHTTDNKKFIANLKIKPTWVMYAAGVLVDNESAFHNQEVWENNVYVNYTGAVSILNELIHDNNPYLTRIIGITSIAGLRGRKSNFIYGSAKSGLHQYLFGLRQYLKSYNIIVQAITPGFVNTKMTKNVPLNKLVNSADEIADAIISNTKSFEVYPNFFWWLMSKLIKHAPSFIISKL